MHLREKHLANQAAKKREKLDLVIFERELAKTVDEFIQEKREIEEKQRIETVRAGIKIKMENAAEFHS